MLRKNCKQESGRLCTSRRMKKGEKNTSYGKWNLSVYIHYLPKQCIMQLFITREYKNHTELNKSISFMVIEHTNRIKVSPFIRKIYSECVYTLASIYITTSSVNIRQKKYHRYIYYTTAYCLPSLYLCTLLSVLYNIHILHAFQYRNSYCANIIYVVIIEEQNGKDIYAHKCL